MGSDVLEGGEEGGGGLKRGGWGGGLAGTPFLLGCSSTFSTFIVSCEKMEEIFFSVPSCQTIVSSQVVSSSYLELNPTTRYVNPVIYHWGTDGL